LTWLLKGRRRSCRATLLNGVAEYRLSRQRATPLRLRITYIGQCVLLESDTGYAPIRGSVRGVLGPRCTKLGPG